MVNRVEEWTTDGVPCSLVAKLADEPNHAGFRREFEALNYYRRNTTFPVPLPYALVSGDSRFAGTCLLMEKLNGRNLGEARLSPRGMAHFQRQMAQLLADLHDRKRATYGPATEPGTSQRWLDRFGPAITAEFRAVQERLTPRSRRAVSEALARLGEWFPEFNEPTLVHGDLWTANIMVDDSDPDRPTITGFVDGSADFAEVEYELAYLRVFQTADAAFFEDYSQRHPLRSGFERRCRFYWLNTMMLHVRFFGNAYLPACERLAAEIGVFP
jgi:fructosamine-3-kinase